MTIQHEYEDEKEHVHVLSYGGGTQSTAMLLWALQGKMNGVIPDFIIFSDTGWEPESIYQWVDHVNNHIQKKYGREIIIAKSKNIRNEIITSTKNQKKFLSIPAFHKNPNGSIGIGRRQCTNQFKLIPINKKIRELLGYAPRKWMKHKVHLWKGISTDEIYRVKPAREKWQIAEYPLIDILDVDRNQCIKFVEDEGLGTPAKSSCIGCPYKDNNQWLDMKINDPVSWQDAVFIDKKLRENDDEKKVFLHRDCVPLDEVDLESHVASGFDNECEGLCGI
jgi:hypothetical protein